MVVQGIFDISLRAILLHRRGIGGNFFFSTNVSVSYYFVLYRFISGIKIGKSNGDYEQIFSSIFKIKYVSLEKKTFKILVFLIYFLKTVFVDVFNYRVLPGTLLI